MRSFFKFFFASLLAIIIFSILVFFFFLSFLGNLASKETPRVGAEAVLVLDLSQHFSEQLRQNPLGFLNTEERDVPGLYDVIRLIRRAKSDASVNGIYIIANSNTNGFAASTELRNALQDFKGAGKFIIAHGDVMTQSAYSVANAADKLYVSPQGFLEWSGYSVAYPFLKGTLEKLEIEPQIFYAGKFKSATEPLRAYEMTPENKLQTSVWLNDLYNDLLLTTSVARKVDTATLHQLANDMAIQTSSDAVKHKLIDAVKYDDEVKDEIKTRLKLGKYDKINFVTINTYLAANGLDGNRGDKIALIYAEGDIVDGKADQGTIGADNYRSLLRKARLDGSVKAIVLRVNSGGGSSLASETIWREMSLAKKEKPVIVSFGDVAASGGYYIACAADSIFCLPTTITGSIGVFGIVPNMQSFFKSKLGVTFDGVQTSPSADAGAIYRPLNEKEKVLVQANVNLIYSQFKERVADGRKRDTAYVDSIAQGRVWTGKRALEIGLVDRIGGIDDAVKCAARLAKLNNYRVSEYPEPENIFTQMFKKADPGNYTDRIRIEIGDENFRIYQQLKQLRELSGTVQARMPFQYIVR